MLKGLFGRPRGPIEPETPPLPPPPLMKKPTAAEMRQLMEYFPLGKKLRYSPEYKKEVILDTLLMAYCVDGELIYSWEAIEFDADGTPGTFLLGPKKQRLDVGRVSEFQFLVPDTTDLERTLDYNRRAMIGRNRQFHRGNTIALISNAGALGVATLENEVDKKFVLKDGPYAQSSVVLLTPQISTLDVTDQRAGHRAHIHVPVVMTIGDRLRGPCIIVDFSEVAMRVRVREGHAMPPMKRGDIVSLDIDLGDDMGYRVQASVLRRTGDACVIQLTGQIRDERLVPIAPLEMLELKAGLLNFGK